MKNLVYNYRRMYRKINDNKRRRNKGKVEKIYWCRIALSENVEKVIKLNFIKCRECKGVKINSSRFKFR